MATARYTPEEAVRRGQQLYEERIRSAVEEQHRGRYLVLDIETGEYEIGEDYHELSRRMHERKPDAALYALRIGYPALGRIGARAPVFRQ